MACCLTVPNPYLNQYWLTISEVLWHSSESNFIGNAQDIYPWYEFENDSFKITTASPRGHWVKYSVSPIYRGRVYRGIGYIAVACWTPFLATHFADMTLKSAIFRVITVIPWTPFAGDSFSRNLLTADAFDPARRRQFSAKSALGQSGLSVKCGREHMLCDGQPRKADHWHLHCITE